MFKETVIGPLAALAVIATAVGISATPATAGAYGYYTVPPPHGPRNCWNWSHRLGQWVWVCHRQTYVQPYVQPYPYAYAPYPYPSYEPYPTYEPYPYEYGPSFGFSFGFGGGGDHRHHFERR